MSKVCTVFPPPLSDRNGSRTPPAGQRYDSKYTARSQGHDVASGDYQARVRTKSDETGWSDWSAPFAFHFGPTQIAPTRLSALEVVHSDD